MRDVLAQRRFVLRLTAGIGQQRPHLFDLGLKAGTLLAERGNLRLHLLANALPPVIVILADGRSQHRFGALVLECSEGVFERRELRGELATGGGQPRDVGS